MEKRIMRLRLMGSFRAIDGPMKFFPLCFYQAGQKRYSA